MKLWSDEEKEALRKGAEKGLNARQIAEGLGRTRQAVIDQARRSGVALESHRVSPPRNRDQSAVEAILSLEDSQCRWPVTVDGRFEFCSNNRVSGTSYCEHHHKRSLAPPEERAEALRPERKIRMIQH